MAAGEPDPSLNLASEFLDRNVTEGRGRRAALVGPASHHYRLAAQFRA